MTGLRPGAGRWHERVLRAQPVRHDPQAIQGGLVEVRPLEAADQLQGVHAGDGQDVSIGVPLGRHREHRVGDRAERRRDDRLVELPGVTSPASHRLYCRSRLASPGSSLAECARMALIASAWLQPRACRSLVHPPGPCGPVLGHQDALLPKGSSPSVSPMTEGDMHGDTGLSPGCLPLTPTMSLVVSLCALQTLHVVNGWLRTDKERAMKLYVDTNGKKVTVTKDRLTGETLSWVSPGVSIHVRRLSSATGSHDRCCRLLLPQEQERSVPDRNRPLTCVELRGFEPLTPSMPLGYSRPADQAIR